MADNPKRCFVISPIGAADSPERKHADMTLNAIIRPALGIAHSEEKPVIHIAHRETRLPFDNIGYRAVTFDPFDWNSHVEAKKQIADFARKALAQGSVISNQVTHARGWKKLKASADPQEAIVANLVEGMARLQEDMAIVKRKMDFLFAPYASPTGPAKGSAVFSPLPPAFFTPRRLDPDPSTTQTPREGNRK